MKTVSRSMLIAIAMAVIFVTAAVTGCSRSNDTHNGHDDHADDEVHDDHDVATKVEREDGHVDDEAHDDHGADTKAGCEDDHDNEAAEGLGKQEREAAGIELAVAAPGKLHIRTRLFGDVLINQDRLAHVVPLVPGVVREVKKSLGDTVKAGEVMAVIDSRELAEAKAAFLAARQRWELAAGAFKREEELWKKKISAEQEYLDAGQALAEARIEMRTAEQSLHVLGLSEEVITKISEQHEGMALTRYAITAPIAGTVISRHITLGEKAHEDTDVFLVADLSTVWVDLNVPQKDLASIRKGQDVIISAGHGIPDLKSTVVYVSPVIDEQKRTGLARIEIANSSGDWKPGLFVTAHLTIDEIDVPLAVSRTAIQTLDNETIVFVQTSEGLEPRPVATGRSDRTHVEIVSGIAVGERYVTKGAFDLKAKIITSNLDPHAGHGH